MTENTLGAIAGAVLSLLFEYVPRLREWYDGRSEEGKRLIMLAVLIGVSAGIFGLSCAGRSTAVSCSEDGIWQLIGELVATITFSVIGNQSMHRITKRSKPEVMRNYVK